MEKLTNKVYELEGLLELASKREDKLESLRPLIGARIDDICRIWREMNEGDESGSKSEKAEEPATINDIYRLRRERGEEME